MKLYIYILTLITLFSCSKKQPSEVDTSKESTLVELTDAQIKNAGIVIGTGKYMNINSTIEVNGVLDVPPQNLVSVSALMGGFVKSTILLQGKRVTKGEVLATIQNPEFIQLQSKYLENKEQLLYLEQEYNRQEELVKENVSASKVFQKISSEYKSLQAQQGALEEQLQILNINTKTLNQSTITSIVNMYAPISGFVTEVNINIGKFVSPQDVICQIVDTEHLHAELTVFEKDVSKLRKGQKLKFYLVNESDKMRSGSIFLINKTVASDRTVRVHAHLDKEDPTLIPNMYLKAIIDIDSQQSLTLPDEAIVNSAGVDYVFLPTGEKNQFKAISVIKGETNNGFTAINSSNTSLDTNTKVIVKNAYSLLAKLKNVEEE